MTVKNEQLLIIGGSDAGISAAIQAKESEPTLQVKIILADEYPNLSICGFPYAASREVPDWHSLSHRGLKELEALGIEFDLNTLVNSIDAENHLVSGVRSNGAVTYKYNKLIVATGAIPKVDAFQGFSFNDTQENNSKIHVLHTMSDYLSLDTALNQAKNTAIIGAGYIGVEMAEAMVRRKLNVTLYQRSNEILSTVENEFGSMAHQELTQNRVTVLTDRTILSVVSSATSVKIKSTDLGNITDDRSFDTVLIVTGVQPNTQLLEAAGAKTGVAGAISVDEFMHTTLPDIWAAGDLVETDHRLLGKTYLPLGTTAHKQGRIAGLNVVGQRCRFRGIVGTQVIRAFNLVIARTGLLPKEAENAGFSTLSSTSTVFDHNSYFPNASKITIKLTADKESRLLLGAQLIGNYGSEIAKRNDIFATAIFNKMTINDLDDLDLSYSPPIASPWDPVQQAAQDWEAVFDKSK
jgi:NADPH-dependent 2,4-dienoyl-CoA reductase/sulfur reductase-like enzyme